MKISKERIISIIILFFKERKKLTDYALSEKVGVDPKSIKDWANQERDCVRNDSVTNLVLNLQNDIASEFENFSEFVIAELEKDGINKEFIWKIFDEGEHISNILEQLLELDISEKKTLQENIGTANIIRTLKSFLVVYREYFQVSEKGIGEEKSMYFPLIYSNRHSDDVKKSISEPIYLILKFPNAYYVGIILCNYIVDYSDSRAYNYYLFMIEKLKTQL